jgi:hypothetical protein
MSRLFRAAAVGISMGMTACAIHPLPEDVTGLSTVAIVSKIRCEAAGAVQAASKEFKLTGNRKTFFEDSVIAYNFTLDITEVNNVDATLDLTKLITNGTGTAALTGGVDRTRENARTFTIADTFKSLLDLQNCSQYETGQNHMYPIIGRVGVDEMVRTFVLLAFFDNLAAADATKSGAITMGDTLTFTTKIQTSLTPKIVLTPIGPSLQIADSNIAIVNSRNDQHKVLIGLARGDPTCSLSLTPAGALTITGANDLRTGFLVTAPLVTVPVVIPPKVRGGAPVVTAAPSCPAQLASKTIEQMITRFELGKPNGAIIVPSP